MDKLPQLEPVTILTETLCGHMLKFRKAKLEDSKMLGDIAAKGMVGLESNVYMLAALMYGYEEDFNARLNWLNSLQLNSFNDITKIQAILAKLGLQAEQAPQEKNNKKK